MASGEVAPLPAERSTACVLHGLERHLARRSGRAVVLVDQSPTGAHSDTIGDGPRLGRPGHAAPSEVIDRARVVGRAAVVRTDAAHIRVANWVATPGTFAATPAVANASHPAPPRVPTAYRIVVTGWVATAWCSSSSFASTEQGERSLGTGCSERSAGLAARTGHIHEARGGPTFEGVTFAALHHDERWRAMTALHRYHPCPGAACGI